ncbi:MAG: hypothetical protein A2X25_02355 [Chloroflexi bacterium GWB2_49_20]|nr:MAG: hypothetical protein A2X25_02355 [Chloroflexi bacterium GWB2_49_20]OGN79697.1 MAG: hypothetical protein A2X26_07335 [Chloroflexi bacterium GWC2_49_37]OGN85945.1 MAG: hypothetical protein A2X27_00095 [Chloroflexi bacterium GWD2_49_16]HBG73996.1 hypothetical protein [Anaerolineae bacterium]HCC78738.1 hypothetical protein [Anaerolineae bacterium]
MAKAGNKENAFELGKSRVPLHLVRFGKLIMFSYLIKLQFRLHGCIDNHSDQFWQNVKSLLADPSPTPLNIYDVKCQNSD